MRLSLELATRGASLIVSDIDRVYRRSRPLSWFDKAREAQARGRPVCDVSDRDAVFALVEEAEKRG